MTKIPLWKNFRIAGTYKYIYNIFISKILYVFLHE